ncbi:uncharacterized protein LOC124813811 [Hydra vulgaris]|uniref:uncharacterized protein LOC124813811 n=1 Tax=Hydra vulgaris TaxID=6087 RepID=UPI001F5FDBE5|nr:uncharacterized protein LOC124813811 [Hydra vulgaris]XP_047137293.1 uncharacterized protein LOC124813811 [Hydra vulgaris]
MDKINLERIRTWSEKAVKEYLILRNKDVDGDFETLVFRVFSAIENETPIDNESEDRQRLLVCEYKSKLILRGCVIPDPFSLKKNWLSESGSGLYKWPSIYYTDIEKYLRKLEQPYELMNRLDSDYKEGKAYRYYKCEFVKEIYFHEITEESDFCFLKSRVTPSQRTSSTPYHVWAAVKKDNERPGGEINSAYCTCIAGLLGCCNHVIAMLFRVEAAVCTGATKPSCTSVFAKWKVPSGIKTVLTHKPLCDVVFNKHHYKKGNKPTEIKIEESNKSLKEYVFCTDEQKQLLSNKNQFRDYLYKSLKDVSHNSCFVELYNGKSKKVEKSKVNLPLGVVESANNFKIDSNLSLTENVNCFTESLALNDMQIKSIEEATRMQSSSSIWFNQRQGRITASKFKSVFTRIESKHDSAALLKTITKINKFETFATRHGIATEAHAKRAVVKILKENGHKNIKFYDSGMQIYKKFQFISASPDLIVECCCGIGCVEIKCPYIIRDTIPTVLNYNSLHINVEGKVCLKKTHDHYFQIQGQLGVLNILHAWYFVFTHHGHYLESILFDKIFFERMLKNLLEFWYDHLAPFLLYTNTSSNELQQFSPSDNLKSAVSDVREVVMTKILPLKKSLKSKSPMSLVSTKRAKISRPKQSLKSKSLIPVLSTPRYVCSVCKTVVPYIAETFEENSVACETCNSWFHFHCVGIKTANDIPSDDDSWMCEECKNVFLKQ